MFTGIFPRKWACAKLIFLPKDGNSSNPGNWRPISQTNIFSKLLERIVHASMLNYLRQKDILSCNQFVFLPGKSTHQSLFNVIKHIYGSLNNNKILGCVYLDVAKAFNCINHKMLYYKMYNAGFSDIVIRWFRSYLTRSQIVSIGDKTSSEVNIPAGIAQGTVLGPLIFVF